MTPPMTAPDTMSEKLKPCPFWGHVCGRIFYDTEARAYRVVCEECGASTGAGSKLAVVTAWNTRSEAFERLVRALEECRDKFLEYERLHLAKIRSPNSRGKWPAKIADENRAAAEKAERNAAMARMCNEALGNMVGEESSSPQT